MVSCNNEKEKHQTVLTNTKQKPKVNRQSTLLRMSDKIHSKKNRRFIQKTRSCEVKFEPTNLPKQHECSSNKWLFLTISDNHDVKEAYKSPFTSWNWGHITINLI